MKLKLDFPIDKNPIIDYRNPVLSIGSCFAESIAQRLSDHRFDVLINPNGIIYNPISLADVFMQKPSNEDASNIIEYQDLWHSWNHHGSFSSTTREELMHNIEEAEASVKQFLNRDKGIIFVTFGSAHAYFYQDKVVANCHKVPGKEFEKRLLDIGAITNLWRDVLAKFSQFQFVLTVSPVRYIKDGLHQSNLSKSTLLLAVNELVNQFDNAAYFPAYEIVIDELRDYRFYGNDMVHVSELAVDYIWERFVETMLNSDSQDMVKDCAKINQLKNHRILHPESPASLKLIAKRTEEEKRFENKYFTRS